MVAEAGPLPAPDSRVATQADLERALEAGSVELVHLVDACWRLRGTPPVPGDDGLAALIPRLEGAYRSSAGFEEIKGSSFYRHFRSGVVMTETGKIFTYYDSQNPVISAEGEKLLWDLEGFSHESEELLGTRSAELGTLGRKLYELTLHLLYAVDEATQGSGIADARVQRAVTFVTDEFAKARRFRDRAALRVAQGEYLRGMVTGVGLLSVATAVIAALLAVAYVMDGVPASVIRFLLGSFVSGAIGAVLSVLQRLTSGKLVLDVFAGPQLLRRLGSFRPLVGALFGIVTFAAVEGGVLPLDAPGGDQSRFFFYCALAFIAGFNERWAQDMLGKAGQDLAGPKADAETPGQSLW